MAAQNKTDSQSPQGAATNDQTASVEAKYKAELEELRAQNARLNNEAETAKAQAREAEKQAKEAREEAAVSKALLAEMDAKVEAEAARQEALITRQLKEQRRVRIVIPSGRGPSGRAAVPVGINGKPFSIPRDKEVDVPQCVLNVLDLAKELVPEMEDVNGQAHVSFREVNRISYHVKGIVDPTTGQLARQ